MAGEFTGGNSQENTAASDKLHRSEDGAVEIDGVKKFPTDAENVFADDQVKVGTEVYPVFDVDSDAFMQNMTHGRKRVRFKSDTPAYNYMKTTRYNRPFYISNTDAQGKKYTRRIK